MYIPYISSKEYHKYPFGAMKEGTSAVFRIVLPRNFGCTGARLVIKKDGEDYSKVSMQWDCMQGDSEEWWKVELTFDETGLYFYHFEYDSGWGTGGIYRYRQTRNGCLSAGGDDWQTSVYSKDFTTPEWIAGGIFYQIFPDRFCCSNQKKENVPSDRILRNDYLSEPYWKPDKNGKTLNNDYFCGDFKGIEQKLGYLESLGVNCIYLNPIFEAHSNHRYDTADYEKTDPLLGTEEDFRSLCKEAKKHGIKIILDGVFSHTGSDSRYFNKKARYKDLGAYQSKQSPYFDWYKFRSWPDDYVSWWGIDILPELDESNPGFIDYITGEGGIAGRWLKNGASGWRLDVADELPDEFLESFRASVKKQNPQALIIGEVWEDASNKSSYGKRRHYLDGTQLDSVMNYPFAQAIIDFVRDGCAEAFDDVIMSVTENYPKPVTDVLMNHIGTHDTQRAITALAGENAGGRGRAWQSGRRLDEKSRRKGVKLLKEAAVLQFTLPGVPCIYYGDETGLEGYGDPFNRRFYPWGNEDGELIDFYRTLGKIRRENSDFVSSRYETVSALLGCVAYKRGSITVIANSNPHPIRYNLPPELFGSRLIFGGTDCDSYSVGIDANSAVILKR